MYKLHGKNFFEAVVWLAKLRELGNDDARGLRDRKKMILRFLDNLDEELANLNLPLSRKQLFRTRLLVNDDFGPTHSSDELKVNASMYSDRIDELYVRIEDEIESSTIYCLSSSEAEFVEDKEAPFGDKVAENFPDTAFDLEEARKCMVFGRWTAVVFHLMRALEHSVSVLGEKVGATVMDAHGRGLPWGVIISNLDDKIETMPKSGRNKWSQARALLYHVNQCWRTETMHPKQTYTEEEARAVYDASRSFMRYLSQL